MGCPDPMPSSACAWPPSHQGWRTRAAGSTKDTGKRFQASRTGTQVWPRGWGGHQPLCPSPGLSLSLQEAKDAVLWAQDGGALVKRGHGAPGALLAWLVPRQRPELCGLPGAQTSRGAGEAQERGAPGTTGPSSKGLPPRQGGEAWVSLFWGQGQGGQKGGHRQARG